MHRKRFKSGGMWEKTVQGGGVWLKAGNTLTDAELNPTFPTYRKRERHRTDSTASVFLLKSGL